MIEIAPIELDKFTAEEYAGGVTPQKAYVKAILSKHGVEIPDDRLGHVRDSNDYAMVGRFFREEGYPPSTQLGQLVQLIASEQSGEGCIRNRLRGRNRPDAIAQQAQESLGKVRLVKKQIAASIFGDQAVSYSTRLTDVFFAHRNREKFPMPGKDRVGRMAERNRMVREVVEEIRINFPLTSR